MLAECDGLSCLSRLVLRCLALFLWGHVCLGHRLHSLVYYSPRGRWAALCDVIG